MSNAFTAILKWFTDELPFFLLEEPVVYFVGAAMLLLVIGITARLLKTRF